MSKLGPWGSIIVALMFATVANPAARAQSTDAVDDLVYRCEDAQGHRIYSDLPCRQIGALALPSVLQPQSPEPGLADAADPSVDEELVEGPLPTPREAEGCPGREPELLVANLVEAAEAKQLNRLAAMFHWVNAGRGTVNQVFAIAERLAQAAPLIGNLKRADDDDAWLWAGLPPPDRPPLPVISVRSVHQPSVYQEFRLIENAGCFWLLPP